MGKKNAAVFLTLLTVLLSPIEVNASSVDELYAMYNISPSEEIPADVKQVLNDYNDAKRFVAMYNYVDLSVPDTSSQDKQIADLQCVVRTTEEQLLNSYTRSFEEIVLLEEKLTRAKEEISRIQDTYDYVNIKISIPDITDVPSTEDYTKALLQRDVYNASKAVGDLQSVNFPTMSESTVTSHNTTRTLFSFTGSSGVSSLLNGTVHEVGSDYVTVKTFTDVFITYYGLDTIAVSLNDTVYQYQYLGTAKNQISVRLSIRNKNYDLYKLFEGD